MPGEQNRFKTKLTLKAPHSGPWIPFWIYNGNPVRLTGLGDGIHHVYVRFGKESIAFKRLETSGRSKVVSKHLWEKLPQALDTKQSMADIVKALKTQPVTEKAKCLVQ